MECFLFWWGKESASIARYGGSHGLVPNVSAQTSFSIFQRIKEESILVHFNSLRVV